MIQKPTVVSESEDFTYRVQKYILDKISQEQFTELQRIVVAFQKHPHPTAVPDLAIRNVSLHIFMMLSHVIDGLLTEPSNTTLPFTQTGLDALTKIVHFLVYIRYSTQLTIGELLHIDCLLSRLLSVEVKNKTEYHQTMVSIANLGTLLVCASIIALKMNRDHSIKNTWWATVFSVNLETLNQSEAVYLQNINFNCYMSCEHYRKLQTLLIGPEEH